MKLKGYFYTLCVWILFGIILYVLGAFVEGTWNSNEWATLGKVGLSCIFLGLMPLAWAIVEPEKYRE